MSRQIKSHELRVRLTKFELEKFREESEKRGMTVSELVRYLGRQLWDKPLVDS